MAALPRVPYKGGPLGALGSLGVSQARLGCGRSRPPDGEDLRHVTRQPENYDPPHGPIDRGRWLVHLAVDPSDRDDIARAAPTVLPAERVSVRERPRESGDAEVSLEMSIFAKTREEAIDRALYDHGLIRAAAGLDARSTSVLG